MIKSLIILMPILLFSTIGRSQYAQCSRNPYETLGRERVTIISEVLNESKDIYIGLPSNYNDSASYPLVVILEGEILFETISSITKIMGDVGEIPKCIVVGIPLHDKYLDYAPEISSVPESGTADRMLEFYKLELFPALDSIYSTTKERLIWAHSALAGIFCTYLLLGPDNQFNGILSSSPNLRWMQDYISKDGAFDLLSEKKKLFYYLTFGGNEAEPYMEQTYPLVQDFVMKLNDQAPKNLAWKYQFNDNNTHFTNALESYMEGLKTYFEITD